MKEDKTLSEMTRRDFIKSSLTVSGAAAIGVSGSLAAVLGLEGHDLSLNFQEGHFHIQKPPVPGESAWMKGEEITYSTSCCQCPVGCGIHVRVVEGRGIKIEPDTTSPINRGGIGPKGQAGLEVLYDPDRIQQPLKQMGKKGSNNWKPITWDEAIRELTEKLKSLRQKEEPYKLAVLCGRPRGFMKELWQRFCAIYGTPNFFDSFSFSGGEGPLKTAANLMLGSEDIPTYDWDNTMFVLSLGAALFEAACQGIYFSRLAFNLKHKNAFKRPTLIHVDPAASLTAKEADEWIPITPGMFDLLALSISHILVRENLYDKKFITEQTFGFEKWKDSSGRFHPGFRDILKQYAPEKISSRIGIPAERIIRLAHELAENQPSIVLVDSRSTSTSNGLEIARSALALNALLGSINRPGGVLLQQSIPLTPLPAPVLDDLSKKGDHFPRIDTRDDSISKLHAASVEAVPESILSDNPYPVEALLLYYTNPLYSRIDPKRWEKAFEKIPFIASFSPVMDESNYYADLILPDCTYLERWEDSTPAPSVGFPVFGIRRPVVEPLHNTKNTGDVLIQTAKSLGDPLKKNFPWENFKHFLEDRVKGLHKIKEGSIQGSSEHAFFRHLRRAGHWEEEKTPFQPYETFFKTPSKKFEFYSPKAQAFLMTSPPVWEGDPSQFPFYFLPYKPATYAEGSGANQPWLHQIRKLHQMVWWDSWIEINQRIGENLGIQSGDWVWVSSPSGEFKTKVRLSKETPVGIIWMARGMGHTQMGRFAKRRGENPNLILIPHINKRTGIMPVWGTRAAVKKA
jgi:anaerobic selenocysteine-containing dehydrogenase